MSGPQSSVTNQKAIPKAYQDSSYSLFILAITVVSLINLAIIVIPWVRAPAKEIAWTMDYVFCLVFLFDFFRSLAKAPSKWGYLKWGWIDFLGSLPSLPIFRILRALRLVRVWRIIRKAGGHRLLKTALSQRANSSLLAVIFLSIMALGISGYLILVTEIPDPNSNINTAEEAIWWTFVTMTTVGYGDYVPVSVAGRITAVFLMAGGIGLFSVFTGYLSKIFKRDDDDSHAGELQDIRNELAEIKQTLHALNQSIEQRRE